MPADADDTSDSSHDDNEGSRRDELARAIEEFENGETPTENEVLEAFLS